MNQAWRDSAICHNHPDVYYWEGEVRKNIFFDDAKNGFARARAMCDICPVNDDCLEDALMTEGNAGRWGIRAGKHPRERDAISDQRLRR